MKKNEVQIGGHYIAKVSNKLAEIVIGQVNPHGGWDATNVATGKAVRIKSAQRLRRQAAGATALAHAAHSGEVATAGTAPVVADQPWFQATGTAFTDALNAASPAQLRMALEMGTMPARNRNRIEAALANKLAPQAATPPAPAAPAAPAAEAPKAKRAARAKAAEKPEGQMSGLDAAAKVLAESAEPMNAKQIVAAAQAKGYWSSNAATPHATIYAAMVREIAAKGGDSRFVKTDKGLFTARKAS